MIIASGGLFALSPGRDQHRGMRRPDVQFVVHFRAAQTDGPGWREATFNKLQYTLEKESQKPVSSWKDDCALLLEVDNS